MKKSPTMNNLGEKIKNLRIEKGWSQEDLASSASLNLRTIQRIENNHNQARGKTLQLICQALEIPIKDLNIQKRNSKPHLIILYLSTMSFFIAPFLNVILPYLIWQSGRHYINEMEEAGKRLINFQILWSLITMLIVSVFALDKIMANHSSSILAYSVIALYGFNLLLSLWYAFLAFFSVKKLKYPQLIRFF